MKNALRLIVLALSPLLMGQSPGCAEEPAGPSLLASTASALAVGEFAELETGGFVEGAWVTVAQLNEVFDWADTGVWVPSLGRVYFIGQKHLAQRTMMYYDESDNYWHVAGQAEPTDESLDYDLTCVGSLGHAYDHSAIDLSTSTYYWGCLSGEVLQFNLAAGTQATLADTGFSNDPFTLEFFPGVGLVAFDANSGGGTLKLFNGSTWDTEEVAVYSTLGYNAYSHPQSEYSEVEDVLVIVGGSNGGGSPVTLPTVHSMANDTTVTQMGDAPFGMRVAGGGTAGGLFVAEPGGRFLYLRNDADEFWEYNRTTDTWTELTALGVTLPTEYSSASDGARTTKSFVTRIDDYGVVMFLKGVGTTSAKVYLYKHDPTLSE